MQSNHPSTRHMRQCVSEDLLLPVSNRDMAMDADNNGDDDDDKMILS